MNMNRIRRRAAAWFGGVSLALGLGATDVLAADDTITVDSPTILVQVATDAYRILDADAMDRIVGAFWPLVGLMPFSMPFDTNPSTASKYFGSLSFVSPGFLWIR
nr:hypothetical protein [Gammaproteobacteria bacterium]